MADQAELALGAHLGTNKASQQVTFIVMRENAESTDIKLWLSRLSEEFPSAAGWQQMQLRCYASGLLSSQQVLLHFVLLFALLFLPV